MIPSHPNCVYAALGFVHARAQHRGGVRFSTNNGNIGSWTSLTAGIDLHQTPVADVAVHANMPGKMAAASYGRGLWLYDWAEALPAECAP